jgi:flagellar basal-body rod protein FlgC
MAISSLQISGSGLTAERARLDAIARNIANADTTRGPDGGPYKRQMVVFEAVNPDGGAENAGGVKVAQVIESPEKAHLVYRPGHPDADDKGIVAMPNLNIVEEMVDMITATRAYEANTGAANATKSMISAAIGLGRP